MFFKLLCRCMDPGYMSQTLMFCELNIRGNFLNSSTILISNFISSFNYASDILRAKRDIETNLGTYGSYFKGKPYHLILLPVALL